MILTDPNLRRWARRNPTKKTPPLDDQMMALFVFRYRWRLVRGGFAGDLIAYVLGAVGGVLGGHLGAMSGVMRGHAGAVSRRVGGSPGSMNRLVRRDPCAVGGVMRGDLGAVRSVVSGGLGGVGRAVAGVFEVLAYLCLCVAQRKCRSQCQTGDRNVLHG